jgi:hypothetical protein
VAWAWRRADADTDDERPALVVNETEARELLAARIELVEAYEAYVLSASPEGRQDRE